MIYQVILAHFYLAAQDLFRHWKTFDRQQKEEMGKKSFPEARAAARRGQNIIFAYLCVPKKCLYHSELIGSSSSSEKKAKTVLARTKIGHLGSYYHKPSRTP
jgi:hypothetical protein